MIFLGKELSKNNYPFIVAELSCNHEGSLDQAKKLIDAAKSAGADAVKIQVYIPDEMTLDESKSDFIVKAGQWKAENLYHLYEKTQTDYDLAQGMMIYAKSINIPCFASVFSQKSLSWLETEKCPAYKIASFELPDTYFIRKVAKTGKPLVLSTGMATLEEIDEAMNCVNPHNVILLHCVSAYPTRIDNVNLWKVPYLANLFNCPVGFSDHTRGIMAGPLAVAAGARMLEKHLALPETNPEDAAFSLHPDEFKSYVTHCRVAAEACFKVEVPDEEHSKQFRRSLYAVKDIKAGDGFTLDNIRSIRPSFGLSPRDITKVIYKRAKVNIKAGTALTKDMME